MKLRKWRKRQNVSVKQLAALCGVSESAIRHYETGTRKPRTIIAQRIEQTTNGAVSAAGLLGVSESAPAFREDPARFDHELKAEAKALGLDPDAIAQKAIEDAVKRKRIESWIEENRTAMEANARDIRENGLWSDGLRAF